MSQKKEKYARVLCGRMDNVETGFAQLEHRMKHWEDEIATTHIAMLRDAQQERSRARREAAQYRRLVQTWKAVAYGALIASSLVLALAIVRVSAMAAETPAIPPLVVEAAVTPPAAPSDSPDLSIPVPAATETPAPSYQLIFESITVTHYCICEKCCGKTPDHPAYGITASGRKAVPGYSVAVDPKVIALGTVLYLDFGDGELVECRADDTGSGVSGAHIDLCVADHETALALGVRTAALYLEEVT